MSREPQDGSGQAVTTRVPAEPPPPGPGTRPQHPAAGPAGVAPRFAWRRAGTSRRRREPAVWLAAPGALFFLVIVGIPLVIVAWTSFLHIGLSNIANWATAPFAGLSNYAAGLTGPNVLGVSALASLWISIKFSLLATLISTPIALFAALSVYHPFRGRAVLRSLYLLPYVMPGFVIALLANIGFLNTYGPVDRLLAALHLASVNTEWLVGGGNSFWAMTITEVWEVWPFIYLLLLAGLTAIPKEQLEAAAIDGAGWLGRLRYIVAPQLKGLYALAFFLSSLFHFGNFTLPFILFGNTPPPSVDVLPLNIYYRAFRGFDFGIASATAVFNVAVLAIPAVVYLWVVRVRPMRKVTADGSSPAARI